MKALSSWHSIASRFSLLFFAGGLAMASAHEVWIEDTPEGQLFVRFAEYGDKYEKSPGHLDSLSIAGAFTFGAEGKPGAFEVQKKSEGYLLINASPKGQAFVEAPFAVMGGSDKPGRKPIFYARWHAGNEPAKPTLTFDIVPTGQKGEARVFFRGQPLADVKVKAYLPDGSELELTADKEGVVRLPVRKTGLYLLACQHQREAQNGFSGGRTYDTVSHNCSLAWRQP